MGVRGWDVGAGVGDKAAWRKEHLWPLELGRSVGQLGNRSHLHAERG